MKAQIDLWRGKGRMYKVLSLVLLILLLSPGVLGDIVELDLFTLGCPTEFSPDLQPYGWQSNFDLGINFLQIDHVYIEWAGGITAGLAQDFDPDTFEPIGDPFPLSVGIYASLSYPPLRNTEIWGGSDTYPDPELFNELSEIPPGESAWSDLLDGQNEIKIHYQGIINAPYIEYGSVTLTKANLVIEGIVVPEPASLFLIAVGAFGIRISKIRKNNKPTS